MTKNGQEKHQPELHNTPSGDITRVQTQVNHLLRMARKEHSWSQGEMAERIGVAKETISRWENGVSKPQPNQLRKLREVFGKTSEELGYPIERLEEDEALPHTALNSGPEIDEAEHLLTQEPRATLDSSAVSMLKPVRRFLPRRSVVGKVVLGGLLIGGLAIWLSNEAFAVRRWPLVTFDLHRRSELVRVVQWMLKAHQYDVGPSGVDGVFGPLTQEGIMAIQRDRHLSESGRVDDATWEVLTMPSSPGSRGSQVFALQDYLRILYPQSGLSVDGDFGPQTAEAVRRFRQQHHIPVKDEADLDTWCLLVGGTLPDWKWLHF